MRKCCLQAYKDVSMLLETQMKRAPANKKTRLNIFYVLSSICRQSKKRFKEKDKYGELSEGLVQIFQYTGSLYHAPSRGSLKSLCCCVFASLLITQAQGRAFQGSQASWGIAKGQVWYIGPRLASRLETIAGYLSEIATSHWVGCPL